MNCRETTATKRKLEATEEAIRSQSGLCESEPKNFAFRLALESLHRCRDELQQDLTGSLETLAEGSD